ncbi:hypothetical protein GJ700_27510 [Duganella sp. FT92W]|uniref:Uncharacterized protein n=1 Tax=Pseudoduganella rivuli TaxID=2666085 RepID=A0A7X2IU04_9BURK|nr:hypothetical protein [Pseudoduganella rivuli]MRV75473.1 hypothetical protein [Pseudoduganella rivuli]
MGVLTDLSREGKTSVSPGSKNFASPPPNEHNQGRGAEVMNESTSVMQSKTGPRATSANNMWGSIKQEFEEFLAGFDKNWSVVSADANVDIIGFSKSLGIEYDLENGNTVATMKSSVSNQSAQLAHKPEATVTICGGLGVQSENGVVCQPEFEFGGANVKAKITKDSIKLCIAVLGIKAPTAETRVNCEGTIKIELSGGLKRSQESVSGSKNTRRLP